MLNNVKSKYILKKIFGNLNKKTKFSLVKYNKNLQDKSDICFEKLKFDDYKEFLGENRKFDDEKIQKYIEKSDEFPINLAIFLSLTPENRTYNNLIKTLKLDSSNKKELKALVNDLYKYGQYSLNAFRALISKDRTIVNLESFFMLYNRDNMDKFKRIPNKFETFLPSDMSWKGKIKANKLELIEKLIFSDRQSYHIDNFHINGKVDGKSLNERYDQLEPEEWFYPSYNVVLHDGMNSGEKIDLIFSAVIHDSMKYKDTSPDNKHCVYLLGLSDSEANNLKEMLHTSDILRYINKAFKPNQLHELNLKERSDLIGIALIYGGKLGYSQVKRFLDSYPHRNENSLNTNDVNDLNVNKNDYESVHCIII